MASFLIVPTAERYVRLLTLIQVLYVAFKAIVDELYVMRNENIKIDWCSVI